MLCEVPLTKEQQAFATAHHSLVYKFLNENRLPEDEFYDVVIFGYLKAVRDYFSDLTAQQFTFSTIANRRMKFCLFDYFRTQGAPQAQYGRFSVFMSGYIPMVRL